MSIKVQVLVDDVRNTLLDEGSTKRWSDDDLTLFYNSAVLQLALVRPDSTAKTSAVALASGTKQSLPSDGLRLIDVVRNMGADGLTPGAAILKAERSQLETYNRTWHSDTADSTVKNFTYDDRNPKTYYVTPPVTGTVYAEIAYSAAPSRVASADIATTDIAVDDVYYGALKDWMLREAYQIEISMVSEQRARTYERSFYQSLGLKYQSDRAASPNSQAVPSASMVLQ
jgi:hypothetical protein